jgi:L-alanine-DL-glutamate epimerase-like enolase superfamily enzyme
MRNKLRLLTRQYRLPLRHPFTISRSSISVQPTLIVELTDGTHRCFGEATTNEYYGITMSRMIGAIDRVRDCVESIDRLDPPTLWNRVQQQLADEPFALCALDQAAYDLWGKQQGAPVYKLWRLDVDRVPVSNFTIGIDTTERMVAKLKEVPGWPAYKIKLGTADDIRIVRELRRHTDAVFRVDANCGWSADETIENSHQLKGLGVEFIEQPLPADDHDGARRVYQESSLPIIADESCISEHDVQRCCGSFHGVNIKLVKCGGMTPARRMIEQARQLRLKVMVGCMTESSVGISAIAQLLPLLDYVDMDGAALLAHDIANGATVEHGICRYADENGNGVSLMESESG